MSLSRTQFQTDPLLVSNSGVAVNNVFNTVNKHRRYTRGQTFGHTIGPSHLPNIKKLSVTAGTDLVYLPFAQDEISSMILPNRGPRVFITDNMSGCCVYIGKRASGRLVVFHANTQIGSSEAEMTGKPAHHQSSDALVQLDTLMRSAISEVGVVRVVAGCSKAAYNGSVGRNYTTDEFLGGTTIAGFRRGGGWQFWYQTWGSVGGNPSAMLDCREIWRE